MGDSFSADEIFQMAERIEASGAAFYADAAGRASRADTRNLLLDLAEMEHGHQRIFADMRARLSPADRQPTVFDPDNESAQYLAALADVRVFDQSNPALRPGGDASMTTLLRLAVGREQESIAFYTAMTEFVPPAVGRERLGQIIKEEMRHVAMLTAELARQ